MYFQTCETTVNFNVCKRNNAFDVSKEDGGGGSPDKPPNDVSNRQNRCDASLLKKIIVEDLHVLKPIVAVRTKS